MCCRGVQGDRAPQVHAEPPKRCAQAAIIIGAIVAVALIAAGICALTISRNAFPAFAKNFATQLGDNFKWLAIGSIALGVLAGGGMMACASSRIRRAQPLRA